MIQPESESDQILTVGQLRDEIAEQLLTAGIEDYEISARRIVEEATGVGFDVHLLEDKNQSLKELYLESTQCRRGVLPENPFNT